MDVRSPGKTDASHESNRHHPDTKANCTRVSVAGLSKAVNIVLDEVLVNADDQYHITQSVYPRVSQQLLHKRKGGRDIRSTSTTPAHAALPQPPAHSGSH